MQSESDEDPRGGRGLSSGLWGKKKYLANRLWDNASARSFSLPGRS